MLDDSYFELLTHVENKLLISFGFDHWGPELKEKLKLARNNVNDTRTTKNLNPSSFYESNQILNRWIRIPESIAEIRLYINSQLYNTNY